MYVKLKAAVSGVTMRNGRARSRVGAEHEAAVTTSAGIPVPAVAGPEHVAPGLAERLGRPGEFPYTRGVRPQMYRDRPWTIRQLAGFGTARDTNERYRMLLDSGSTAVNGVFDYPSLRAFDSDDPRARPDVGRAGWPWTCGRTSMTSSPGSPSTR
jgi:Methylmalonyl-CoA mutase, N-terminal domain/subunit